MFHFAVHIRPIAALLAVLLLAAQSHGDDWPAFRGADGTGAWRESGLMEKFPEGKLAAKWTASVGNGYSGPTVADGRVYVMDRVGEKGESLERVLCFDADSGQPLWTHKYACDYQGISYEAGPRTCVVLDGPSAYSLGAKGHLYCLDAKSGSEKWSVDLGEKYKIRFGDLIWGVSASPVVVGDLLIVQVGGKEQDTCLVAFDKKSGQERWRALDDRASYSTPLVVERDGRRVLICWTGDSVAGLLPDSGQVLWRVPFKPSRMVLAVASPVLRDDRLFVTGFYDGSMLISVAPDMSEGKLLWHRRGRNEQNTDALHSIIATPYLSGGHAYGVDSYGEFRCLELEKGDRVWESDRPVPHARWSTVYLVEQGERIWMFNERGELIISRLSPQGYEEIDRRKIIEPTTAQLAQRGGVCWSHPAFAMKSVFVRNDTELVRVELGEKRK